ncbi:MAG: hypothetical protein RPR40_10155 [Bermanella sp.]
MPTADNFNIQPGDKPIKRDKNLHVVFEDQDLLKRFKAHCKMNDLSFKAVTEALVAGYLSGELKVDCD